MPKNKRFYQDEVHKNVVRGRFLRSVSPVTFEKLRDLLNEHKSKKETDRD